MHGLVSSVYVFSIRNNIHLCMFFGICKLYSNNNLCLKVKPIQSSLLFLHKNIQFVHVFLGIVWCNLEIRLFLLYSFDIKKKYSSAKNNLLLFLSKI